MILKNKKEIRVKRKELVAKWEQIQRRLYSVPHNPAFPDYYGKMRDKLTEESDRLWKEITQLDKKED